jgi:hypothetical protein
MKTCLSLRCEITLVFALILVPWYSGAQTMTDDLQWIVGTWVRQSDRSVTYETWRRINDRTYEGEGTRVSHAGGDTVFTESLLLAVMGGEVFYIAKVEENVYPVAFRMTSLKEGVAVFENPDHDFPQRITYSHNSGGSMTVLVETLDGTRHIDFFFTARK